MPPRTDRELTWDGCLNVRDLGGHATEDGGETSYGRVIRADSVRQLSDAGWAALVDYGVETIVDLRLDDEREADPPADVPIEAVLVSLFDNDRGVFALADEAGANAEGVPQATQAVYLIFLERFAPNVAAAIRAVATAPPGGVVVHCMGGKDRTGLVTALLLRLAGVGVEEIAADYALSEERLRPRHEAWFAEAVDEADLQRLRRIASTPAAAMTGVLAELDRRYGSVEGYLRESGLTSEELSRVRARLRD